MFRREESKINGIPEFDASELITPCLVLFPERVRQNVREAVRVAGGTDRLRPHVKTHKTREIVQIETELGIRKHKCATLAEAEMLAECAVADILVAYPQVGPAIEAFCNLIQRFPNSTIRTTVDAFSSAQQLALAAAVRKLSVSVLVDVDIGMHRTGTADKSRVLELAKFAEQSESIVFGGIHAYDGHNHMADEAGRASAVDELTIPLADIIRHLQQHDIEVSRVVCGGTPTFPMFAGRSQIAGAPIELSPGTCILHDHRYQSHFPDIGNFEYAAVLLTRVISKPAAGQFTCDLGHKAVAADPAAGERCHFVDLPDAEEVGHNEEHLVIRSEKAAELQIGDLLRVIPTHVCPTMALHDSAQIICDGKPSGAWKIAARHRIYRS